MNFLIPLLTLIFVINNTSMDFRTELHLNDSLHEITYDDKLLLVGSCFSENIGKKLSQIKYSVNVNPIGIIYHPIPLHNSIIDALHNVRISESDLNKNIDGRYTAWNFHSKLCTVDANQTLHNLNVGIQSLRSSLLKADYMFITYGTAYYYEHKEFGPVANCHKFPNSHFNKKLSSSQDLVESFEDMFLALKAINPDIKILMTVSPIRHIKDGIIANNRSKAALITAVHTICEKHNDCQYLPSYELLIDDLRDYRYYNDDMVHPSPKAINYIWHKIKNHILDASEANLRSSILKIVNASTHRPFNPASSEHQKFKNSQKLAISNILENYPAIDFSEELKIFED